MRIGKFLQWETTSGEPITVDRYTVTPQSQALLIRFPYGGYVWNRPVAVLVDDGEHTERIAIVDVTKMALIGISAITPLIALLAWLIGRPKT